MKAFLSYSRKDSEWVRGDGLPGISAQPMMEWVKEQLEMIGVELWIDTRLDQQIGEDFAEDIRKRLMQADLAIILVSQDFITSPFIASKEMAIIRQRVDLGEMRIFPILVSTVIWQHNDLARWIDRFQVYPARNRPLHNEMSSLRDMKTHRTEILLLIKNIMAERSEGAPAQTVREQPSPMAASAPSGHQSAAVPRGARRSPWLLGGLAFTLLLISVILFLRPQTAKNNNSSDSNTSGVNLPIPELHAESKNLDMPPATFGSSITLEWSGYRVPDTDKFEVELAKSPSFAEDETFKKLTDHDGLTLERAQQNSKLVGRLYWRVRVTRTRGKETSQGPWSETGAFEVYDNALSRIVLSQRLMVGTSAIQNLPGDTIRKREGGNYEGLDADIVAEVATRLKTKLGVANLAVQFVSMPWNDLMPVLSRNQVDIIISGITATARREREYKVKFSRPYYSTAQVAMAVKASGISSLADAMNRTAYSIEGRSGNRVADAVFPNSQPVPGAVHYEKLFEVLRDHPDAVVVHDYAMLYSQAVGTGTADQYAFFPIVSADLPASKRKAFLDAHDGEDCDRWSIAVSESQTELLNEINGCIDWLDAEGKLSQLIVHHNYPESSLQNCQVTVAILEGQTEPVNGVKEAPKPSPAPSVEAKPSPAPSQKPEVDTVPF